MLKHLTSLVVGLTRSDATDILKLFRCLGGPSKIYRCCFCTFLGFSCNGVVGGDDEGVELSDDEDELSDGNVAKVQYEPSDSPSL